MGASVASVAAPGEHELEHESKESSDVEAGQGIVSFQVSRVHLQMSI